VTRIAFYAPMKPPDHPVPSGDREVARNLLAALTAAEFQPILASDLRLHDKTGDATVQARLRAEASAEVERLIREIAGDGTQAWVTYHNYYKCPDLIGPLVAQELNLPYIQIEASRAQSRLTGRWADFAAAAEAASDAAQVILYFTAEDLIALSRDRVEGQSLVHLHPFLPVSALPDAAPLGQGAPILCAGMMRDGDKLASYRIVAETFERLGNGSWRAELAGDGDAREEVQALMAPFGDRVHFLGQLDREQLAETYRNAGLFFWPGVNEAFGMVYLEAQAAGLPVVAQDRPGVRDVLTPGNYPSPAGGPAALARRIAALLRNPDEARRQGAAARAQMARHHLLGNASDTLGKAIRNAIGAAA